METDYFDTFVNENRLQTTRKRSESMSIGKFNDIIGHQNIIFELTEEHRARSCEDIGSKRLNHSRSPLKSSLRKTIKSVKKILSSTETTLSKALSSPNVTKYMPRKAKHSSTTDKWLDDSEFTPAETRRRKVSWANKINDWLGDEAIIPPSQGRRQKVSWASDITLACRENPDPFDSNNLKEEHYFSDGQLNKISENQNAEQIALERNTYQNNLIEADKITNNQSFIDSTELLNITSDDITERDIILSKLGAMAIHPKNKKYLYHLEHNEKTRSLNRNITTKRISDSNNNTDFRNNNTVNMHNSRSSSYNDHGNIDIKNKQFYATDDIFLDNKQEFEPKKTLQRCLSSEPRKLTEKRRHSRHSDENENERISTEDIKYMVEEEVRYKLDDKTFDQQLVTSWCKEISTAIRERLKLLTKSRRKVIATTYIGSKTNENQVHVSVKCQKNMNTDDFLTVALEGDDMYTWVTLLLADY